MKLLPNSLAGQLTLLLLLALAVAQVFTVALFSWERTEAVRHAHQDNVIRRMATLARLLQETPPTIHDTAIAAASTELARFSLTDAPLVDAAGSGAAAAAVSASLSAALDTGREQVKVAPLWSRQPLDQGRDGDEHFHSDGPRSGQTGWFTASVMQRDGRWLNVLVGPPPEVPPWDSTILFSFVLSAMGIAVVAVLTGRRIANPMRNLAAAADRLGRGEAVDDLPEAGPRETRDTVRAFNVMRNRLDRLVRDRTAMLAAVSHDLRTPITSLRLHAEFIGEEETREKIVAAIDEMQRMTSETLAFIREDVTREETSVVDLHALVDSVAADLADLGHEVVVGDCGRILVEFRSLALRRAMRNLLENAVAYGNSAKVRITRDDGQARIEIEDEGPGIAKADLERVFEPFVRLETSRSLDTGGAGLGLAIARTILRSHGGDIWLENRAERGLRATVSLPCAE
ncbi:MAG: ATP-binding protein [Albidovulum sp.]|nr:ATP-binding protein [Albidovulum sp.]MDE0530283.1 ATP-binding protein [Albidovulum sp.]